MSRNPTAKRIGLFAMDLGAEVVVQDRMGHEIVRLDPATAAVWEACTGDADARRIAEALQLDVAVVWAALDRLADADLLIERASPPGSVPNLSRRKLLARVGFGMGVAAVSGQAAMAAVTSEAAGKADRRPKQEQARKRPEAPDLAQARKPSEQRKKTGGAADAPAELAHGGRPTEQKKKSQQFATRPTEQRRKALQG